MADADGMRSALGPVMSRVETTVEDASNLLRRRGDLQQRTGAELEAAIAEAETEFKRATRDAQHRFDKALAAATFAQQAAGEELGRRDKEIAAARTRLARLMSSLREEAGDERAKVLKQIEEAQWICDTVAESDERQANTRARAIRERIAALRTEVDRLRERRRQVALDLGVTHLAETPAPPPEAPAGAGPNDTLERASVEVQSVDDLLTRWSELVLPRVAWGPGFLVLAAALVLTLAGIGFVVEYFIVEDLPAGAATIGGAVLGALVALPLKLILSRGAHRRVDALGTRIGEAIERVSRDIANAEETARERHAGVIRRIRAAKEEETRRIEAERAEKLAALGSKETTREAETRAEAEAKLDEMEDERRRRAEEVEAAFADAEREAREAFDRETADHRAAREQRVAGARARAHEAKRAFVETWGAESARLAEAFGALESTAAALAPAWDDASWDAWSPSNASPQCTPIARLPIMLDALAGESTPSEAALTWPGPTALSLPIALEFPRVGSLLIEAAPTGRSGALELAREAMLRLLTTLPTGKVRFTIVDPVGLGQSFAAFMHLADHEERLISGRIWTDPRHIEQRLGDLTEHMERVIQKYLRNEFESIEQYNERAGEIAEAYRFLVLADFPTNLTDVSARRLASIADSGARCGVHFIVVADPDKDPPVGVTLDDLRARALVVESRADALVLTRPDLAAHPLAPVATPDAARTTALLNAVGLHATDASLVQVPFDAVAPGPGERWTRSASDAIRVPLGRKGANRLQDLELGHGTLQHALIAGKTGSGKSTLLHVLIASAALWYSPDELELYLIDFKKGVEFRAYADPPLPHARVVAIETDREFGRSVLRRLDQELGRRGELFRELSVQSLPDYRAKSGTPLPRTLLVIDEFQELFVEDDAIAQEASLLLDRLVRQGRAFGMHVLLGSQTLGGAYSIARTTMGQMNVRIALQCDEQDSYLILSEDNAAARLLERPGEAIYNNAAGRVEGNSPFQIVWLPTARRDEALREVVAMADERGMNNRGTIVFEGNVPADPARNAALVPATGRPARTDPVRLYLGEPTAIAPSTAVELRRQGGANLLVIGQRPDGAAALATMAGVSFAMQHAADAGARLFVLDGTAPDSDGAPIEVLRGLPIDVRAGRVGDGEALLLELDAEASRRADIGATGEPPLLLIVHALHRFRDLRRSDDFGFSMGADDGEGASRALDQIFAKLLERGPEVGIHVFAWCDTVTNLERTLDRRTVREFDQRVLFQMSANDSTAIMDSPAATRLGPHRALLWNDEEGTASTFRPYAMPDPAWLAGMLSG